MLATVNAERGSRALEFGIYRDGDNNLDAVQALTLAQAQSTSAREPGIEFTVEDTTARRGFAPAHVLRSESYTIADGKVGGRVEVSPPHDMSSRENLARFVAHTLDNAEQRRRARRPGSIWWTTAVATAVDSKPITGRASCAPTTWRARSRTASRSTPRLIPRTLHVASTAWSPINV